MKTLIIRVVPGLLATLGLALAAAGCGPEAEAPAAPGPAGRQPPLEQQQSRLFAEQPELEAVYQGLLEAPLEVRREVLRACDKWKRLDGPCEALAARRDQLLCWAEDGQKAMERGIREKRRQRAINKMGLLHQFHCMTTKKGWRNMHKGF